MITAVRTDLECWRRVNPKQDSFNLAHIAPAMGLLTGEIEAVARGQLVVLHLVKPKFAASTDGEDELFTFVMIRTTAGGSRCNVEQVRLHGGFASGEQLNANARLVGHAFALAWADEFPVALILPEEGEDIGFVED